MHPTILVTILLKVATCYCNLRLNFVGKRIKTNPQTLDFTRLFRFVLIILYSHCFATHLLEDGVDVCRIKQLFGHTHIQSTTFYLHLLNFDDKVKSPLDTLPRKQDLLNVGYFHIVFTVPSELNSIIYRHQRECYKILFRCVAETLKKLALDKKYLGAEIALTAVLHTWGQNLCFHPHIHCIVPAGGLNEQGFWVNSRAKFFLPVKVLSRKFRGKFLTHLKELNLDVPQTILNDCYHKEWVVYCKPPFKRAVGVVQYLGRYTHRIAISNERIVRCENGNVTFKWRDYKDCSKWKEMTLTAHEFMRRFLMHVLPKMAAKR